MSIVTAGSAFEAKCLKRELVEHQITASAVDVPPSTNRGGNFLPPLPPAVQQRTKIDWLAFSTPVGIVPLRIVVELLFPTVVMVHSDKGMLGYPECYNLTVDDVPIGVIAYGAAHGKDLVSITGKGCALWHNDFMPHVLDCLETCDAKITRCDIAMDFYRGEVRYEDCLGAYHAGEMNPLKGGRKFPTLQEVSTKRGGTENLGRTLYVGSRKSSKMLRCYEKGLQVFAQCDDAFKEACTAPGALVWGEEQGAPAETVADQWFRVEVEYKSKDLILPLDMVMRRDEFFAGAYPFCARLLGLGDGVRPAAIKPDEEIDLHKMLRHMRNGYGNTVATLKKVGYSDAMIIDAVNTGRMNQRLVRSGVVSKMQAVQDFDIPF